MWVKTSPLWWATRGLYVADYRAQRLLIRNPKSKMSVPRPVTAPRGDARMSFAHPWHNLKGARGD
jgi:hypothetical protein